MIAVDRLLIRGFENGHPWKRTTSSWSPTQTSATTSRRAALERSSIRIPIALPPTTRPPPRPLVTSGLYRLTLQLCRFPANGPARLEIVAHGEIIRGDDNFIARFELAVLTNGEAQKPRGATLSNTEPL
jgi:hypothetical protein